MEITYIRGLKFTRGLLLLGKMCYGPQIEKIWLSGPHYLQKKSKNSKFLKLEFYYFINFESNAGRIRYVDRVFETPDLYNTTRELAEDAMPVGVLKGWTLTSVEGSRAWHSIWCSSSSWVCCSYWAHKHLRVVVATYYNKIFVSIPDFFFIFLNRLLKLGLSCKLWTKKIYIVLFLYSQTRL